MIPKEIHEGEITELNAWIKEIEGWVMELEEERAELIGSNNH